jgi:hypothetical protein
VLVLTPGNTADCVMAEACISLIPGVTQLLADKGYDTNSFRSFLKANHIRLSSQANPIARSVSVMTKKPTKAAMWSGAASAASRTSDVSPLDTTSSPEISFLPCASSLRSRTGYDLIESRP